MSRVEQAPQYAMERTGPSLKTLLEGLHMGLNRTIGEAPQ